MRNLNCSRFPQYNWVMEKRIYFDYPEKDIKSFAIEFLDSCPDIKAFDFSKENYFGAPCSEKLKPGDIDLSQTPVSCMAFYFPSGEVTIESNEEDKELAISAYPLEHTQYTLRAFGILIDVLEKMGYKQVEPIDV